MPLSRAGVHPAASDRHISASALLGRLAYQDGGLARPAPCLASSMQQRHGRECGTTRRSAPSPGARIHSSPLCFADVRASLAPLLRRPASRSPRLVYIAVRVGLALALISLNQPDSDPERLGIRPACCRGRWRPDFAARKFAGDQCMGMAERRAFSIGGRLSRRPYVASHPRPTFLDQRASSSSCS